MDGIRRKIYQEHKPHADKNDTRPAYNSSFQNDESGVLYKKEEATSHFSDEVVVSDVSIGIPRRASTFRASFWGWMRRLPLILSRTTSLGRGIFLSVFCVGIIVILLSTVFARVTLTIQPKVEQLALDNIKVVFDANISRSESDKKIIPAERIEFSQVFTKEFSATGQMRVEEKARGNVNIYNRYSASPQKLIAGTRLLTDKGILYRLVKSVTVPGAKITEGKIVPQFVQAEAVAESAGEEYNRDGEVQLKIPGLQGTPKYDGFYAVAGAGFSRGFRGEARVISKDDVTNAQGVVTKELYNSLSRDILGKIPPDFKFLDIFREIQMTKVDSPSNGERADNFSVTAEARVRALIFRESDIVQMLSSILVNSELHELVSGGYELQYQLLAMDLGKGRADVSLRGTMNIRSRIFETAIRDSVKGKKQGSIAQALKEREDIADFEATFFPPWLIKSPQNPEKIYILDKNNN